MGKKRFKLLIEYDGRHFHGWQRQENAFTVQEAIETAISRFTALRSPLFVAGRTDTGVHAKGQVAHIDLPETVTEKVILNAANAHLRDIPGVKILSVDEVSPDFHARFSATFREYTYLILNRPAPLTFQKGLVWQVPKKLNIEDMKEAASYLIGFHDFSSFRAAGCQSSSPLRSIESFDIEERDCPLMGNTLILFRVRAKSFLYHQVRNMVGSLKLVGEKKWTALDFKQVFQACDRTKAGPTAPPDGLYLQLIGY